MSSADTPTRPGLPDSPVPPPGPSWSDGSPPPRDRSDRYLALAGVLTGLAGIAVSQAVATAFALRSGPVVAVSTAVRDYTPGFLAVRLVHLVGHLDKPLLVGGTSLVLLALTAYAGVLTRSHSLLADLVFMALAFLGIAGVAHDSQGLAGGIAVVAGLLTWLVVLRTLTRPVLEHPMSRHSVGARGSSRRTFLVRSGVVVVGAGVVMLVGDYLGRGRGVAEQARRALHLPVSDGSVPGGADIGVKGLVPWRTPESDFYRVDVSLGVPAVDPAKWSLRIHGMVDREITFNYQDLLDRRLTQAWVTLCCVSNEVGGDLIGNAYWSGVLVRDLLAEAGVQSGADAVKQSSVDGWTCGTPLTALTDDRNAMLAIAMNGEPLPLEHGFPVRTIVPGLYGYVSATKWLTDFEVTTFDRFTGYWTDRGWGEKGPVKTESRIDVPSNGAGVDRGRVGVGGVAWAQHTGIAKVEYQLDGGPWREADLGTVPGVDTWVQWGSSVEVDEGDHQLVVRATDRGGYTQTPVRADVLPDGATGWHTVNFNAS